ncbi:MAG: NACHT domain-containing protein [Cyanobacteria bacterium P01_D01_bin.44]
MVGFELLLEPAAEGLASFAVGLLPKVGGKAVTEAKKLLFNASQQYIATYKKRHCLLKVLGMREPVNLAQIYTGVKFLDDDDVLGFESAETLEQLYRQSRFRGYTGKRSQGQKRSGIEVANEKQYLMVLGGPGAGKSTFLRKVGLEALRTFHYENATYRHRQIPVLLELKRFEAETIDITTLITEEFDNCGFPDPAGFVQQALKQGKLLILLDGLDEVPTANLDNVIRTIQDFVDRHDPNRFIASCRTAAYWGGFTRFSDVGMADFDDEQIEQFIQHWFSSESDIARGTGQKCWEILQEDQTKAAKELAHTPLLLTFLCLVYDRSQRFPANRSRLYQKALRILLEEWAAEKRINRDEIYEGLSTELEEELLSEIAFAGFEADQLFFSQRELTQQIKGFLASNLNVPKTLDGVAVLQAIEVHQGILVERAEDAYSFSHLTLQEYLTAQYLVDNHQWEQMIEQAATESRWREVFLLVPGLLTGKQGANAFLKTLEQKAQQCLQSTQLQQLVQWADIATQGSPGKFNAAAKRLAAIFLVRGLARARDLALNNARILDRTHALDLARDLTLNLADDLVRTRDLVRALDLVSRFARARDLSRDCDLAYDLAKRVSLVGIFRAIDFPALTSTLENLKSINPNAEASRQQKHPARSNIFELWFSALDVPEASVSLPPEEIQSLADYFYICELMVRCKEAAVRVSPEVWADIEARLVTVFTTSGRC